MKYTTDIFEISIMRDQLWFAEKETERKRQKKNEQDLVIAVIIIMTIVEH